MALTLSKLEELVKKEGLTYFKAPDKPILRLGVKAMFARFEFLMLLELDGKFLQFRSVNLLQCRKNHPNVVAVLQVLAKINYKVRLLKMGWDESDGEIVGYADTWIMDNVITQEQFSRLCHNFITAMDVNHRRIKQTIDTGQDPGDVKPEEALASLDDEAMPEALRKMLAGLREKLAAGKKKKRAKTSRLTFSLRGAGRDRASAVGLDNYAARGPGRELTEEDFEAFGAEEIRLCGGVLSGSAASFRGKVYSDLVLNITGESLYEEWIPPETVKKMHEALERCDPSAVDWINADRFGPTEDAVNNLRKFFKVCADRNLGLVGWW